MGESENKPSIHIHLDQQVTIEAVQGQEEVEDATVATEITGFDVEQDLYVLRGALSFTGFLRQEDPADQQLQIPDELDDRDVFATAEEVAEAPVLPFHYRLPFILQVPVAAQQSHQREEGILSVNPRVGQWNVHVLGPETLHLRAELVIQGLSGLDGYVFRCGSQEEGAVSKLDHLLDQEEARAFASPLQESAGEAFEAPFAPWPAGAEGENGENALYAEQRQLHELAETAEQEDDWVIETSQTQQAQAARQTSAETLSEAIPELRGQEEADAEEEEQEIVFTPDPSLVFPMPEPGSEWARELEATDRAFGQSERETADFTQASYSYGLNSLSAQVPPVFDPPLSAAFPHPWAEQSRATDAEAEQNANREPNAWEAVEAVESEVSDDDAFVVEFPEEYRSEELQTEAAQQEIVDRAEETVDQEAPQSEVEQSEVERAEEEGVALLDAESVSKAAVEYEFEDELPPQEMEAEEEPIGFAKPFAPKLSFGSKPVQPTPSEQPLKLSQLLGDSRTEAMPEAKTFESQSFQESAQLVRESLSSYGELQAADEDNLAEELIVAAESASIYTSSKGHSNDSFWREILNGHDEKVTMKFRIVQEEESLPMLAEHYHTTINDLLRANNLQRQEVEAGQILYIPTRRR